MAAFSVLCLIHGELIGLINEARIGEGSSMLGPPKRKYLGSVGPVEERGMAKKSGVSLTSI